MDEIELLIDLHINNERQGPGSDKSTNLALTFARLDRSAPLTIADIGCGTGASALYLAKELPNANITAIDFLQPFLNTLNERAEAEGVKHQITTSKMVMDELTFDEGSLDLIWSEGAIYNIGFERGIKLWKPFLKEGGVLAVSEITWTTDERPDEIESHWNKIYPEIGTASDKIQQLEAHGYKVIGYFTLPEEDWNNHYYNSLEKSFPGFLELHNHSDDAQTIVKEEKREIALFRKYSRYLSYGFYIAQKV